MSQELASDLRFGISDSILSNVMDWLPAYREERPLVAGLLKADEEYLVVEFVPLWFNFVMSYVVFTDERILFASRTLWKGVKEVAGIPHDEVYGLVITPSSWKYGPAKLTLRLRNGEMICFCNMNRKMAQAMPEVLDGYLDVSVQA